MALSTAQRVGVCFSRICSQVLIHLETFRRLYRSQVFKAEEWDVVAFKTGKPEKRGLDLWQTQLSSRPDGKSGVLRAVVS